MKTAKGGAAIVEVGVRKIKLKGGPAPYVQNNPATLGDPDGHCAEDLCVGEFILVSAAVTYTFSPQGKEAIRNGINATDKLLDNAARSIANAIRKDKPALPAPAPTKGTQASQSQSQSTPADPNGKKGDGGAKKTEHGQQRADEARQGDAHRDVGDVNRTINDGKQYTDSDTGYNVSVRGDRVVITNEDGDVVSQFKNTRANTQQRIDDGKWIAKPPAEPEVK